MTKPPNSRVNLDKAIERLFGSYERNTEVRSIMANTIIGQLLPDGVVKGGTSLKLRYGSLFTRVTTDLDMACKMDIPTFAAELGKRLAVGWHGFTGTVVSRTPATPKGIPTANAICRRLFAFRHMQSWPASVVKGTDWDSIYNEEKHRLAVLQTADEAIAWANDLIRRIAAAQ